MCINIQWRGVKGKLLAPLINPTLKNGGLQTQAWCRDFAFLPCEAFHWVLKYPLEQWGHCFYFKQCTVWVHRHQSMFKVSVARLDPVTEFQLSLSWQTNKMAGLLCLPPTTLYAFYVGECVYSVLCYCHAKFTPEETKARVIQSHTVPDSKQLPALATVPKATLLSGSCSVASHGITFTDHVLCLCIVEPKGTYYIQLSRELLRWI